MVGEGEGGGRGRGGRQHTCLGNRGSKGGEVEASGENLMNKTGEQQRVPLTKGYKTGRISTS